MVGAKYLVLQALDTLGSTAGLPKNNELTMQAPRFGA